MKLFLLLVRKGLKLDDKKIVCNFLISLKGGSGCLGQHIIKHLEENDAASSVKEIRVLDVVPFENRLAYTQKIPVKTTIADVSKIDTKLQEVFKDVDVVYHCAAFMSISFPPKIEQLERVNVEGSSFY